MCLTTIWALRPLYQHADRHFPLFILECGEEPGSCWQTLGCLQPCSASDHCVHRHVRETWIPSTLDIRVPYLAAHQNDFASVACFAHAAKTAAISLTSVITRCRVVFAAVHFVCTQSVCQCSRSVTIFLFLICLQSSSISFLKMVWDCG